MGLNRIKKRFLEDQKMIDCLFCKIVKGDIPSNKIYEDDKTLAFLDIFPSSKGHTLVIPKKHEEFLHQLDDETSAAVINTVKKMSKTLSEYSQGVSVLQRDGKAAGQVVQHVHFHIIPREEGDDVSLDQWDGVTDNKDRWNLKEVKKELKKILEHAV
jgi:histidine triad (HIT) family protein